MIKPITRIKNWLKTMMRYFHPWVLAMFGVDFGWGSGRFIVTFWFIFWSFSIRIGNEDLQ